MIIGEKSLYFLWRLRNIMHLCPISNWTFCYLRKIPFSIGIEHPIQIYYLFFLFSLNFHFYFILTLLSVGFHTKCLSSVNGWTNAKTWPYIIIYSNLWSSTDLQCSYPAQIVSEIFIFAPSIFYKPYRILLKIYMIISLLTKFNEIFPNYLILKTFR